MFEILTITGRGVTWNAAASTIANESNALPGMEKMLLKMRETIWLLTVDGLKL